MRNKIELTLIFLVAFGLGLLVMKTYSRPEQVRVDLADEKIAKSIFSSGCEIGIMKNCPINNQEECRKFCILFIEANSDIIKLILKGNAER